jgi:1-phosphatidylinositol-3-phosphate 5-kinase
LVRYITIHICNLLLTIQDIIKKFATRVCDSLRPQIRQGDHLDIRNYAKIKVIPEGSREECQYVDGVVFTKNIGHKKLKSRVQNAKVLLLSGGLE